jgi:hypothetical protein
VKHTKPAGLIAVAAAFLIAASAAAALPNIVAGPEGPRTGSPSGLDSVMGADAAQLRAMASFYTVIPTPVPTPTPKPTPKPTAKPKPKYVDSVANAKLYARNRLGATQYACLDKVFYYESKWNPRAENASGAYGIPQAKPGNKMATFGSNWRTSPLTQVKWGIWYVNNRYGSACGAWDHIVAYAWY